MARGFCITPAEGNTGISTIDLGVLATLTHGVQKVGVFQPIARSITEPDYVLSLLLEHDATSAAAVSGGRSAV